MSITDNRKKDKALDCDRPFLRQISPKDTKWDDRKAEADQVGELYQKTIYDPLAGKIKGCAGYLEFGWGFVGDVPRLKLQSAWFCRIRYCPVCMWRKSLAWRAKAFKAIPKIIEAYPSHRWLSLTLTVRNCEMGELRATLGKMGKAWTRLAKDKKWPAVGWLRSFEVTRGQDGSAHPHYHCLLLVPASYFSGAGYVNQKEWEVLWQKALKIDYPPNVHIKAVTGKKGKGKESVPIPEAILETLQYSVKPADLISDQDWLIALTQQTHGLRSVATGGILKEFLKGLEKEPEDLIHVDEDSETEGTAIASLAFDWNKESKRYRMAEDDDM